MPEPCKPCGPICTVLGDEDFCQDTLNEFHAGRITKDELMDRFDRKYGKGWRGKVLLGIRIGYVPNDDGDPQRI